VRKVELKFEDEIWSQVTDSYISLQQRGNHLQTTQYHKVTIRMFSDMQSPNHIQNYLILAEITFINIYDEWKWNTMLLHAPYLRVLQQVLMCQHLCQANTESSQNSMLPVFHYAG
jgi:hypothetical protein